MLANRSIAVTRPGDPGAGDFHSIYCHRPNDADGEADLTDRNRILEPSAPSDYLDISPDETVHDRVSFCF